MWSYVTEELPALAAAHFPVRRGRHGRVRPFHGRARGAGVRAAAAGPVPLRARPSRPSGRRPRCPWGIKAFTNYLGADRAAWAEWDSCALLAAGKRAAGPLLVDQGEDDKFLHEQLRPDC